MNQEDSEFQQKLQATFRAEALEHLRVISSGLIELEKGLSGDSRTKLIEKVYRELHTLKGASRSVGIDPAISICQVMESIFQSVKQNNIELSATLFDHLHQALSLISEVIGPETEQNPSKVKPAVKNILDKLRNFSEYKRDNQQISAKPLLNSIFLQTRNEQKQSVNQDDEPSKLDETLSPGLITDTTRLRIAAGKMELLYKQSEELFQSGIAAERRHQEYENLMGTLIQEFHQLSRTHPIRIKMEEFSRMMEYDRYVLQKRTRDHMQEMKNLLLMPVLTLTEGFHSLVRSLSLELGKKVELFMEGTEIEVDKRLLDDLKDPLIHLIRNSLDHGIEKPDERIRLSKKPEGSLHISFSLIERDNLQIRFSDDGAGIDHERLRKVAEQAGIIQNKEPGSISVDELTNIIFRSGISTSPMITELSGRGIGLSIVREKVENMGGRINVHSTSGKGTEFILICPFARSTFQGILVRSGDFYTVFPSIHVCLTIRVKPEEIRTVKNKATLCVGQEIIPAVSLNDALNLKQTQMTSVPYDRINQQQPEDYQNFIIIKSGESKIAFGVTEICQVGRMITRPFGHQLKKVKNFSGVIISETGKLIPVIEVPELVQNAIRNQKDVRKANDDSGKKRVKKILVVEDSITSRMLMKNILEMGGYHVTTAVDGADALSQFRTNYFDLIVSDIDMPRMNGFELTVSIRKEKQGSHIPVVLVTALDSVEDRERGIEAGANAYIVKQSFDRGNLLEIVHKLI